MKFDEAVNYIAENLTPIVADEMAKPKNPEIERLVAQGLPYWKARAIVNKAGGKAATPDVVPVTPAADEPSYKELPDTLATKNKIAEILDADPEVSDEDVISRITADQEEGEALNTDPELIKQELAKLRAGASAGDTENTAAQDIDTNLAAKEKAFAKIRARMAALNYKVGDADKVLGKMGKKVKSKKTSSKEEEPGEEEPLGSDVDDYVKGIKNKDTNAED